MPYNCSSLQSHGVCSRPDDPICGTIRNPLSYHLRKKGFRKVMESKGQKERYSKPKKPKRGKSFI